MTLHRSSLLHKGRPLAALAAAALALTLTVGGPVTQEPSRASLTISFVAQAHAFDPVAHVWGMFRDKVLDKVFAFIKAPIEAAKAGLQSLIDKATGALTKIFESDVIIPALIWAIPKIFPQAGKVLDFVQQAVGAIDKLTATAQKYQAAVNALIQNNKEKFAQSIGEIDSTMDFIQKFDLKMLVDIIVVFAKEKGGAFVRAKTIELLDRAYGLIEGPINAGKAAACSAIGSIPIVGGLLSGAADFLITAGLKLLRKKGFEFVATKAAELAGKAIDGIGNMLKGLAANVDDRIKPALDAVKGILKDLDKYLGPIKAAYSKVKAGLALLKDKGGLGNVVGVALVKKLYDEFIALVRTNMPAAKTKLKELGDKVVALLPASKALIDPVVSGLANAGADSLVKEAARCKDKITALDMASVKATFECLGGAVKTAAGAALTGTVQALWEEFTKLLSTGCSKATDKLKDLVAKVVTLVPSAKSMSDTVITAIGTACAGGVEKLSNLKTP